MSVNHTDATKKVKTLQETRNSSNSDQGFEQLAVNRDRGWGRRDMKTEQSIK